MYWKNILFVRELHIAVEFYNKMVAFISAFKLILTILLLLVVWHTMFNRLMCFIVDLNYWILTSAGNEGEQKEWV